MTEPTNDVAAKIVNIDFLDGGADVAHALIMIITDDLGAKHRFWAAPDDAVRLGEQIVRYGKRGRAAQKRSGIGRN
jgi:hypothetical protein